MFHNLKSKRSSSRSRVNSLLLITAFIGGAYSVQAELELLDGVAVIVNDSVVMVSEIKKEYELTLADLASKGTTNFPPKDQIVEQITERLILESIQIQEAGWRIAFAAKPVNKILAGSGARKPPRSLRTSRRCWMRVNAAGAANLCANSGTRPTATNMDASTGRITAIANVSITF